MEQWLIIIGAFIFGGLGTIHLVYTFFGTRLAPYDANTITQMKGSSLRLTKETTVWKAWIGFNASHSLGAIIVAAVYIPLCISHFEVLRQSIWLSLLPVFIGLSYLILAQRYWFRIPFIGIGISTVCFASAALLLLMPKSILI